MCLSCNAGYAHNRTTTACDKCHDSCVSCYAASQRTCFSCQEEYHLKGTTCIKLNCAHNTYFNPVIVEC